MKAGKNNKRKQSSLKIQISLILSAMLLLFLLIPFIFINLFYGIGLDNKANLFVFIGLPFLMAIVGSVIIFAGVYHFFKPINEIMDTMKRVNKERDLTIEVNVKSRNEFGFLAKGFNLAIAGMRYLVGRGLDVVSRANERLEGVSIAIQEISGGIQEVTGAVNDFADNAQELDKNAQNMLSASTTALDEINVGRQGVLSSTNQIREASAKMAEVNPYVEKLLQQSEAIGKVVKIITDITSETKLLAFNASIEAARAGEHGQGFAVVADEVRNLADQSAKAAKDISEMINGIQYEVRETEKTVKGSVESIQNTASQVEEIEFVFKKITEYVEDMAERVNSIASRSNEINTGTEELSAVTQQQSASIQAISGNVELVSDEVSQMLDELALFKS